MNGHTPGPWMASLDVIPECRFWSIESDAGDVCYLTLQQDRIDANARLIAAAPDLLAACKELVFMVGPDHPAVAQAMAAIAKTEGGAA